MAKVYDINNVTARHIEALAKVPSEIANRIIIYRKKRKRMRHIDELWRIRGMSRKFHQRLCSVFYVPNQHVPKVGERLPYVNTVSTVTVPSKSKRTKSRKRRKGKRKHAKTAGKSDKRELISGNILSEKARLASTKRRRMEEYKYISEKIGKGNGLKRKLDLCEIDTEGGSVSSIKIESNIQEPDTKIQRLRKWISEIPNVKVLCPGQASNNDTGFSYYYRSKQKEEGKSSVKKSKVVFVEQAPKDSGKIDLYNSCVIL